MANWVSEPLWTGPGSGSVSTYWWREFRRASHVRLGGVPRIVDGLLFRLTILGHAKASVTKVGSYGHGSIPAFALTRRCRGDCDGGLGPHPPGSPVKLYSDYDSSLAHGRGVL